MKLIDVQNLRNIISKCFETQVTRNTGNVITPDLAAGLCKITDEMVGVVLTDSLVTESSTRFSYGRSSSIQLKLCCNDLQAVLNRHIEFFDSSLIESYRDESKQNEYFDLGVSKVKWPDGKHNKKPSEAIDMYPWHNIHGSITDDKVMVEIVADVEKCTKEEALAFIRELYTMQAQSMFIAAQLVGVTLRWGGDWNSDNNFLDQTFHDRAHFELV